MRLILVALAVTGVTAGATAQANAPKAAPPAPQAAQSAAPQQQAPAAPQGGTGERPQAEDANKDGKVSFEEAQKAFPKMTKELFDRRDTNHDGFLTPEDRPKAADPNERLGSADTNKDGKITLDEAKAAFPTLDEGRFKRLDLNGDGVISPDDRAKRKTVSPAHGRRGGEFTPTAAAAPAAAKPAPAAATAPAK